MNRLLIIETSATLRHAAKTLAQGAGFDVTTVSNFSNGLKKFNEMKADNHVDGVVLGWPVKTNEFADELFTTLMETEHNDLGVIVLSHIAETTERSWATKRSNTALVLWDDYEEFVDALKSLGCKNNSANDSEILIKPQEENVRILFVDDSPTIRVSYRRLLKDNGYEVETASCVSEAMEKALENEYDIVITDYYMPDGTGDSLCSKLRNNPATESITSAIITGTYSDKAIISSLAAGAVECMFKNEPKELFLARLHAMSRSIISMRGVKKDHQNLQGILSSVGEGVYGVTCEGDITFINPAAKNILGYTDEEQFIGKSAYSMFHNTSSAGGLNPLEECNLQSAYKSGKQLQSWATSFNHANGKNISVECTVYPLYHDTKLEGSVVAFRDVTERRLLLEELKWQATHDQLTKLPNRAYFEQQLIQEVSRLKRSTENSALLYIDLDRFKYINDTAGHMVGDKLLIDVGNKFRSRLREADTLARLGGDEFAVIMRNVNEKDAYAAADNFRNVLEEYEFVHAGKMYKVNASIGIAYITSETRASGEVLANADIACYIAKSRGRNTTHFFHGDNDEISTMDIELGWSARLHDALKNDKFELYYQPILSLADINFDNLPSEDGELWKQLLNGQSVNNLHYEVLLRLPDARGNKIGPDVFLPTAERFNMMKDIDRWVIKHALANLAEHSVTGRSITLTINLSGQSLEDVGLGNYISDLVDVYKIDASKIVFEITETSAIANLDTADRFMNDLKELGCRFALDDFGSGFCSFSHLKYLSVDIIKIDGVFIQGMMNDLVDRAIVESIAQIARSVNKVTVAEFVENVNLLKELRDIGVDYIQGYYVSPPKESSVFPELSFGFDPALLNTPVSDLDAPQVEDPAIVAEVEVDIVESLPVDDDISIESEDEQQNIVELSIGEDTDVLPQETIELDVQVAPTDPIEQHIEFSESDNLELLETVTEDLSTVDNAMANPQISMETDTDIDDISSEQVELSESIDIAEHETVSEIYSVDDNTIVIEMGDSDSNDLELDQNDRSFESQWGKKGAVPYDFELVEPVIPAFLEEEISLSENRSEPQLASGYPDVNEAEENILLESELVESSSDFPLMDSLTELSEEISLELGSDNFTTELTLDENNATSLTPSLDVDDFVISSDLDNLSLELEQDETVFQKDKDDQAGFDADLDSELGKASR